jgi:hypothetical protein
MRASAPIAMLLCLLGAACAPAPPPDLVLSAEAAGASISDEQDFDAVAARETIESDRERLLAQREQFQQIAPGALPQRDDRQRPDIVAYALATTNQPGRPIYPRSSIRLTSYENACARHLSPDRAQEAFLAAGGPVRDPGGLDPDGDGFACGWDPRPFRAVLQAIPGRS